MASSGSVYLVAAYSSKLQMLLGMVPHPPLSPHPPIFMLTLANQLIFFYCFTTIHRQLGKYPPLERWWLQVHGWE
jgi:hypothetical protein